MDHCWFKAILKWLQIMYTKIFLFCLLKILQIKVKMVIIFILNVCYYWSLNSPLLLTFSKNRRILTGWSKAHLLILHLLCFFLRVVFPTFFAAPAAASAGRRGGESGGQQRQQHCTGSVPFRADRCTGRAYSTLHVAHCTLGFAQCVHWTLYKAYTQ